LEGSETALGSEIVFCDCFKLDSRCKNVGRRERSVTIPSRVSVKCAAAICFAMVLLRLLLGAQDGQYRFMRNRFWKDQMYCEAHQTDGTPCCCACERLEPRRRSSGLSSNKSWVQLPDGRHLCLACLESIVVDTQDAQPLYNKVLGWPCSCWSLNQSRVKNLQKRGVGQKRGFDGVGKKRGVDGI
jgi:hypothetical protein